MDRITFHHKIPSSYGGYKKSENGIMLRETTHRALHIIFYNSPPLQRIRKTLEFDKSTLNPLVYEALSNTLKKFEDIEVDIYKPGIFNPDKFRNKK